MRDCPIPRISCSSATESSSSSSKRSRRSRVGSASRRRKLMVDAILHLHDISTYHDWSICWEGNSLNRKSVTSEKPQAESPASQPLQRFNDLTLHHPHAPSFHFCFRIRWRRSSG